MISHCILPNIGLSNIYVRTLTRIYIFSVHMITLRNTTLKLKACLSIPKRLNLFQVQSSAIITQSNLSWYYIRQVVITVAESESNIRITTDTPYLTLMGELWDVYCEDLGENWLRYNGTTLYSQHIHFIQAGVNQLPQTTDMPFWW